MPSILCRPLLLPPSIFPSIRVFPNESALCIWWPKYWSFSFSIMNEVKFIQTTCMHNYSLWEQTQTLASFWECWFNPIEWMCFKHFLCINPWARIMGNSQRWTRLGPCPWVLRCTDGGRYRSWTTTSAQPHGWSAQHLNSVARSCPDSCFKGPQLLPGTPLCSGMPMNFIQQCNSCAKQVTTFNNGR